MSILESLDAASGVLICGHGSRAKVAEEEFSLLAGRLRERFPVLAVEYGFLEYSSPNIHMALDALRERGVRRIFAVPGMLFRATHAKNDIPSVLLTYMRRHPQVSIEYGRELGLHEEMIAAFKARILQALGFREAPAEGELYDTMLVVVGRGTSVAAANAEAAKLTRIVAEELGFGWAETVYSGVTFPSVGRGLELTARLGFRKVVVAPYFLFSGRLIGRIHAYVKQAADANPDVEYFLADYLRDQPSVVNTFVARIEETIKNMATESGLLADFQRRLAAGEVSVHHHHAEFQPHHDHHHEDVPGHDHGHVHAHAHDHGHRHEPYRHIAHPHGPRTMIDENICCCFMSQFPQQVIDEERARRELMGQVPGVDQPQCQRKSSRAQA